MAAPAFVEKDKVLAQGYVQNFQGISTIRFNGMVALSAAVVTSPADIRLIRAMK